MRTIKTTVFKYYTALVLTFTVLLPFAVQFSHSFTHTNHATSCSSPQDLHIDSHYNDCKILHFKINQNAISFNTETSKNILNNFGNKTLGYFQHFITSVLTTTTSRAPPVLL